ncbi:MAG: imidazoleglycerol-phosphate dehydratase HisB [Bacilli bacterium]
MRSNEINRVTKETSISLCLEIEGQGKSSIDSGCPFLDHMLTLFACHGRFNLNVKCQGDTEVDYHHTVEDIGIVLGQAFNNAVGEKKGIKRYGNIILPMDEALLLVAIDISNRSYLNYQVEGLKDKVGNFDSELIEEFFLAFTRSFPITLHIKKLEGKNTHHILEAIFKAFARSLKEALTIDSEYIDEIPSSKGML